ncbi:MAG: class I SAM-dependent methyltransferase [Bacteroidetes bacterium]|nr:MAG: class I SAM-dependent methyltransferase [Bacteroidota bacterium]
MHPENNSCDTNDKSSCSSSTPKEEISYKNHWDNAYANNPVEKLGWYESDLSPTLDLLNKTKLSKTARILNVGAGATTLVDKLESDGYTNIIATDISKVSLDHLKSRLGNHSERVEFIIDDLINPSVLLNIEPVDLWIDRAVLHFFNKCEEQDEYFNLLKKSIKKDGYVILAEYNLNGATKCAGLPVHRYSKEMLQEKLGDGFKLINSFDYTYTMPHGHLRPYIYTLFQKD